MDQEPVHAGADADRRPGEHDCENADFNAVHALCNSPDQARDRAGIDTAYQQAGLPDLLLDLGASEEHAWRHLGN